METDKMAEFILAASEQGFHVVWLELPHTPDGMLIRKHEVKFFNVANRFVPKFYKAKMLTDNSWREFLDE